MAILVSGGAGYIGSHVVEQMIEQGYEVIVFDNLSAGHRQAVHEDATLIVGDLLDSDAIHDLFANYDIDGILHFASHILVGESMQKPFKYLRENVLAMMNLLEVAAENDVKRFILSSTANLFDEPETVPINESEPLIPGSVYGETKFWGERMLHWMDKIYGMKYCALRYFNACGAHPNAHIGEAHDPESHLIPLVLQVALGQRDEITIFGTDYDTADGTCIRDYVHVLDLAEAHILALEALKDGDSRVYNLGSGTGYRVREVIETVRKVTGHTIPAVEGERRAGDLPVLVADSSKIREELGWSPEFDNLHTIIETAWHWHQTHPNGFEDEE
ncbi:MAG: UDP-glucose 4-epimerase GalE [Chloroflexota bacterium]